VRKLKIRDESESYPFIRGGFDHGNFVSYVFVEKRHDGYYTPKMFIEYQSGKTETIYINNGDGKKKHKKEKAIEIATYFADIEQLLVHVGGLQKELGGVMK